MYNPISSDASARERHDAKAGVEVLGYEVPV
jgi:hypothetical protein